MNKGNGASKESPKSERSLRKTIAKKEGAECVGNCLTMTEVTAVPDHPFIVGRNYLCEGVTKFFLGRLIRVYAGEIVLENACWIADTGPYHEALENGFENVPGAKIEMLPPGDKLIIMRSSMNAICEYGHALPRTTK